MSLKICLISAEVTPFAKTGGLGDVTAALARSLDRSGLEVRLFFPFYGSIDTEKWSFTAVEFLQNINVPLGDRLFPVSVFTTELPNSRLPIYLIRSEELFGPREIYSSKGIDHLRFALLTRATLECCQRMGWAPDVFHCNDWHTALLPLYLKTIYAWDELFRESRTLLTIHNIGYQGQCSAGVVPELGLGEHRDLLHQEDLDKGVFGFLKTGILYADALSTVSPTHAAEIQTAQYGMGLEALLRSRSNRLFGIVNGIDTQEWNPAEDDLVPYPYSAQDLGGKAANKQALLEELSLDPATKAPLLGMVSRLVYQKGIDLMMGPLDAILRRYDVRVVVLGSGESRYEEFFQQLESRFGGRVCFYRGFSNKLAHRIEAASDMFLMPSLYEPCGLNQMYSQRYGTVPIVRRTGGLADTVQPFDSPHGEGSGFVFEHATPEGFYWATEQAIRIYQDRELWNRLVLNGMARDFSWTRRVHEYIALYEELV